MLIGLTLKVEEDEVDMQIGKILWVKNDMSRMHSPLV